jgi:hypothetical protein
VGLNHEYGRRNTTKTALCYRQRNLENLLEIRSLADMKERQVERLHAAQRSGKLIRRVGECLVKVKTVINRELV